MVAEHAMTTVAILVVASLAGLMAGLAAPAGAASTVAAQPPPQAVTGSAAVATEAAQPSDASPSSPSSPSSPPSPPSSADGPGPGRLWGWGPLQASTPRVPQPQYFVEDACSREGGVCLPALECPAGLLAQTAGLCPLQRAQGVECCHGVSTADRRCASHGGACMPDDQCAARLQYAPAEDCRKGEACCVLVGL